MASQELSIDERKSVNIWPCLKFSAPNILRFVHLDCWFYCNFPHLLQTQKCFFYRDNMRSHVDLSSWILTGYGPLEDLKVLKMDIPKSQK